MLNPLKEFLDNFCNFYVAVFAVVLTSIYHVVSNRNLPPGPTGLPYIGYWPFLSQDKCHVELNEMTKKYGDVFSFTVTGRTFIHVGSFKSLKEAHVTKSECFGERMSGYSLLYFLWKDGLVFTEPERWRVMRKFFLQQFRERGLNVAKEDASAVLRNVVKEAVIELKEARGKEVDITELMVSKSLKITRLTFLGEDGMSEEEIQEFRRVYIDTLKILTSKNKLLVGEIARYFIIPFCRGFREAKKSRLKLKAMLYRMIDKRRATYDEYRIRDLVDAYFKERNDRKSRHDLTYTLFTDKCLMVTLMQLVGDSSVFMGMFVSAFIKALLDHPEAQEKMHCELMEVCGQERDPEIEDKNKLTYTHAFILEVMRTTDIFPFTPAAECTKETILSGYRIPKGAITVYNFYSAHMNPNDYGEPEKFNPLRFIGGKDKRPEMLPLFGIGKRSCIGEGFAMNQVFLFLATLVKNFHIYKPTGNQPTKELFYNPDKIILMTEQRSQG